MRLRLFQAATLASPAYWGVPFFHGSATSYSFSRQSSGRHSIGAKSRWAMYSGRLKRRMWLDTAQRLRYTLTRFHGERFDVDAWTRHEWNMIIEPTGPLGATRPPRATSFVIVSWSIVHSG